MKNEEQNMNEAQAGNSIKADVSGCFNADGSRKICKHMLFTTAEAGVLCNSDEAGYLLCHVANFKSCDYFEEDKNSH